MVMNAMGSQSVKKITSNKQIQVVIHPEKPSLRIQVCPIGKGLPLSIPSLFGWDLFARKILFDREGSGSLGLGKSLAIPILTPLQG